MGKSYIALFGEYKLIVVLVHRGDAWVELYTAYVFLRYYSTADREKSVLSYAKEFLLSTIDHCGGIYYGC